MFVKGTAMKYSQPHNNVTNILTAICLLVFSAVWVLMSHAVWNEHDFILNQAKLSVAFSAELISSETQKTIELALKSLANVGLLTQLDPSRTDELLAEMKQHNPLLLGIQLVDLHGNVLHSSSGEKFPNIFKRDFIKVYRDDEVRKIYIGEQDRSYKYPEMKFIAISCRLTSNKNLDDKILVAYFKGKEYLQALFSVVAPSIDKAFIITVEGNVISNDKKSNIIDIEKVISAVWEDDRVKGLLAPNDYFSSDIIAAFRKNAELNFISVTTVSTKDKLSFWYKKVIFVVIVAISWGGVILLLSYWLWLTERKLIQQAMYDPLTKLANRYYFGETSEKLLALATREKSPLTVVMIDIDKFKKINDTYGHKEGDNVICSIADSMRISCRNSDLLARLGGDEFCILMPNTKIENALIVIERLKDNIRKQTHSYGKSNFNVTISAGLSESTLGALNIEELLNQSDAALYCSKEQGRNKVTSFSSVVRK